MRKTIIAGNWKMNKTSGDARATVVELAVLVAQRPDVDVIVCPPYTALCAAVEAADGTNIAVGAQDVFWKGKGAYTSQVAPDMLTDLGVTYVIIGHSETRGRFGVPEDGFDDVVLAHFGESDRTVNLKAKAAMAAGLKPIICVGETLAEREARRTDAVVASQTTKALDGIDAAAAATLIFAYEPVWAIGTGKVCDPDEANRVCGVVRTAVATLYGDAVAQQVRVQYGGSVKPDNAALLLSQEHIDGALVGGAALKAPDLAGIVAGSPR